MLSAVLAAEHFGADAIARLLLATPVGEAAEEVEAAGRRAGAAGYEDRVGCGFVRVEL